MGFAASILISCGSKPGTPANGESVGEVNVYSHRHYEADQKLFDRFTESTGIRVNVVKAKADQLIERLKAEGEQSPADLLITVDVGRLTRAKEAGLLQALGDPGITQAVPAYLKDEDNQWVALTKRARVVVYHRDRVAEEALPATYEDMVDPAYRGKILTRSSSNIYNQSWIASMIAAHGEEKTETWAKGLVENFARDPIGNDRAQMRAVAAGTADFAIVNTYYLGLLATGNEEDKAVADRLKIHFPNQDGRGTHINVSGIGLTASSPNPENARKLIAFLLSPESQEVFAQANFEYPVLSTVPAADLVQAWGEFKEDTRSLNEIGALGPAALKLADRAGWK